MPDAAVTARESLLDRLVERLRRQFEGPQGASVAAFARQFFSVSASAELEAQKPDDLYATVLNYWQLIQRFDSEAPKVRVFNPDLEQHGWQAAHTLVQVHHADMPFLVKSVRLALDRLGLAIHGVNNCVIAVQRSATGALEQLVESGGDAAAARQESVIHLEIDRHSDPAALAAIRETLQVVLAEVRAAVNDYPAMRAQARRAGEALLAPAVDAGAAERREAAQLLEWLADDHFIFLGYEWLAGDASAPETRLGCPGGLGGVLADGWARFAKDDRRSRVQRAAYRDLVVVPGIDAAGRPAGEHRFYGLYCAAVYPLPTGRIPVVRRKVEAVLAGCGFEPGGYNYKEMVRILDEMPREELFLAEVGELAEAARRIFDLQERRKASLLIRRDPGGRYYSCLYYVHRDLYTGALRQRVEALLSAGVGATDVEVSAQVSRSPLSRTHFMLYVDPQASQAPDLAALAERAGELSRCWGEELQASLTEAFGEEQGSACAHRFRDAFPSAYREHFAAANAVCDIRHLLALDGPDAIAMSFYRPIDRLQAGLKFKLYSAGACVVLSDVVPILENLGMRVLGEHPYPVRGSDGGYWISDFSVDHGLEEGVDLAQLKPLLQEAFARIWRGQAENDAFNQLVIRAGLGWREVALLRAYARYIKQLRFGFSQPFIAETLARHPAITRLLVTLFRARFDPRQPAGRDRARLAGKLEQRLLDALDRVDSLDDDRILRRFLVLIQATLRTNYFQPGPEGAPKAYLAFKLDPRAIPEIPRPRPQFEVFVYSPRVEGVHLRAGRVARGGIRWSDRQEDYRTEVLGLVKAQQVKNAVIVPMGAKGCFIAKQLPADGDREAVQAEGIACYQTFIRGLLDLTDNRVGDAVVPPPALVRHDEDDPYLVVAADKGTATFSDIANAIADGYGFWLGDAFASGGSDGYDHKKMGITARGAWESVKRHFRERGVDVQTEPFTAVGIGDMGGDVFGNGMLQSPSVRLLAAFNHQHIFVDPDPDPAAAYAERRRLFELPRSSWVDYAPARISAGGGVFARAAKWVPVSPQMRAVFGIEAERLTPTELINALLKAPVDLLWNGGIGTYAKARGERHAEVGDKANDGLRVDGRELRCQVLGEGGNLGFTQRGRIEFASRGGAANTDFIDNAGGVDCSDHEVNIKILLNERVAEGDLTLKQRNRLLREMTDAVAERVLNNNYRQAQALHIAEAGAAEAVDDHLRLIRRLEQQGGLDRKLECLPSDKELQARKAQGRGLTRPELSVLVSYVKIELKQALSEAWITADGAFVGEARSAFPRQLLQQYPEAVARHRLRREIAATQIANDLVNRMGVTFVHQLRNATGAELAQIAAAYLIVREVYDIDARWRAIEALDGQVTTEVQVAMMTALMRLMTRGSHWLLRHRRHALDLSACLERYRQPLAAATASVEQLAQTIPADRWQEAYQGFLAAGVPESLAAFAAGAESLYWLLDIVDLADRHGVPVTEVSAVYFALGEGLDLTWLDRQIRGFQAASHWQALAVASYRDALDLQLRALTQRVLEAPEEEGEGGAAEPSTRVARWFERQRPQVARWQQLLADIQGAKQADCAVFSVALGALPELA